ncbi:hypothetical protein NKH77_37605 [Streptomyces sp. M19]
MHLAGGRRGPLRSLDQRLDRAVAGSAIPPLAQFFADLGNAPVALPVLAAVLGYVAWHGRRSGAPAGGPRRWWARR